MKLKVKKSHKQIFQFILMLIPTFEPKIFTQYGSTTALFICMNLLEIGLFLIMIYNSDRAKKVNFPIFVWGVYRAYLFVVMCLTQNFGGITQWGYLTIVVLNLLFTFEYAVRHRSVDQLLMAIAVLGIIFLGINYCTLIIYDRGIIPASVSYMVDGDYYFLGIKTQFTTMMFPTIAAAGAVFYKNRSKKNLLIFLIAIIICLMNIINKAISTPSIGCAIIIIMMIISKIFKIDWKARSVYIITVVIQIGVIVFNIQTYFTVFLEEFFGKDATLSARVFIWNSTMKTIKNESLMRLLFGNGIYKLNAFVPYGGTYWQPHNQLLTWLHSSGIIGTCIILIFLISLSEIKFKNDILQQFLMIMCTVVLFLSLTEVYFDVAVCYVPFFILYYINCTYKKERN